MEREAKAKVVASDWGADFFQFLAALAVLPPSILKNRMNSTVSSKPTEAKQLARQGIEQYLVLRSLLIFLQFMCDPANCRGRCYNISHGRTNLMLYI